MTKWIPISKKMKCDECGGALTVNVQVKRNSERYHRFICTCPGCKADMQVLFTAYNELVFDIIDYFEVIK